MKAESIATNWESALRPLSPARVLREESGSMKANRLLVFLALLLCGTLLLPAVSAGQAAEKPAEGIDSGNYNYQGSVEFGYRFVDTKGSEPLYNTFVNQQQGPRILEQTLNIRSLNHQGSLFDNLFVNSFGWGGDPENATRLRASKNKWYNFNLNFRRDQNFWDYNLQANPLNPANSYIQVNSSPHQFQTRRRAYDTNLTLAPQSPLRVRLGYSRNIHEGQSYTSFHEGTDVLLFQPWSTTLNAFQIGVDYRGLPKTNISYDQFLQYYKGDTSWVDNNLTFQLSNGTPVDAGLIYNPTANQPCSNSPTPIFDPSTTPPTLRAACNGYLAYSRFAPVRTSYPTEQFTLQSSYIPRVDLSARVSYSASDMDVRNFQEVYAGLVTRTRQRAFDITGPAKARRVVANADLGVTFRINQRARITDNFRFSNFRIPGSWLQAESSLFGTTLLSTPNVFNPATCPPPYTAATCPQHNSSSPADVSTTLFNRFLGQDSKYNTIEAELELSRKLGLRGGYRFGSRTIRHSILAQATELFYPTLANRGDCVGLPLNPDGSCSFSGITDEEADEVEWHEHSLLFGMWSRPIEGLRLNFDLELMKAPSNDSSPTRITPRKLQHYKLRGNYRLKQWVTVSGTMNILEANNNIPDIFHTEHSRNYGFTVSANPKPWLGLDFGYNYNGIFSSTDICYVFGAVPPPGSTLCGAAPFILNSSTYNNKIHFGYTNLMFKPIKRVTANLGYNLVSTSGSTLILNPTQQTLGPLAFNYHKPSASVDVDLVKGWTWKAAWGYYGYNEKSDPGLMPARDFHSNSATVSLKYAF